ncbi:MAG: hypothetical protein K5842_02595 [Bacteroidales bacterium]|nr:hypothetical protein [Bacteroidales bacterium]
MKPLFEPQRDIRDYFDAGVEFNFASKEDKLLEIANCVFHGYNLYNALERYLEEHRESHRRRTFCNTLCEYIGILRGDESITSFIHARGKLTLKQLVNLFTKEVVRLYRHPRHGKPYFASVKEYYDDVINNFSGKDRINAIKRPTPLAKIPITEKELREINPWDALDGAEQYVKPIESVTTLFDERAECVLKCDKNTLDEHNKIFKGTEYEYCGHKWPKPFIGNPFTSKVILLSLNPRFKDESHRMIAETMNIYYCEAINQQLLEQMRFNTRSLFCSDRKLGIYKTTIYEAQGLVDGWYWNNKIKDFRDKAEKIGLPKISPKDKQRDPLYENLSIIQYVGYASPHFEKVPKGKKFPSQYFTKLLIQYLAFNSDKVFVVARSKDKWRSSLGKEIWDKLEQDHRLICRKGGGRMHGLTETTGLEKVDFVRLVDILK